MQQMVKSHIYLEVMDGDNRYQRDWKHHESLFLDKECAKLRPNVFGLLYQEAFWMEGVGRAFTRVAWFGSVSIRCGHYMTKDLGYI